jgi:5-methylcytosine-specific restriction protein A
MGERIRGRLGVKLRRRRLMNEPLCRDCKANGIVRAAVVPDHITPLAQGGEDVDSNIQCLCRPCHDLKTRQDFGWKKPRQATGEDGWPAK